VTAQTLNITAVTREFQSGEEETLDFYAGVNVILGENNAGKTMWMTTIDFLFGDDAAPAEALEELAAHYRSAALEIGTGSVLHRIERHWGQDPSRSRTLVDGHAVSPEDFSTFMLEALGMPELRFPRGSPIAPRTWPRLSWRTLLRQIYRREGSWHDLAYQQPESEQFAVMAQFLGIAPAIFSEEYASLADHMRRKQDLQSRKQHFEEMLDQIGREIVSVAETPLGVTADSIASAIGTVQGEIRERQANRERALQAARTSALPRRSGVQDQSAVLGSRLGQLRQRRQELAAGEQASSKRLSELTQYRTALQDELNKLRRAERAGELIGPLRVTHCPVCDQSVHERPQTPGVCYLCLQPYAAPEQRGGADRLAFEIEQVSEELRELEQLIERLEAERREAHRLTLDAEDAIAGVELDLRQLTSSVAWVVPSEVSVLDREIGGLGERVRQLERLRGTLELRDRMTAEIDRLAAEIGRLEGQVAVRQSEPNFEAVGDLLAAAMTGYLNSLDTAGQARWGNRRVTADVSADNILLLVNGKRWTTALGANLRAYFFMALHYALIKLSRTEPFTYPGFALLDFPANLGQHTGLSDDENYLLAPFIELLARPEIEGTQVIAAGRAFQGLEGANIIQLGAPYV
jgi:hypothetical protein